MQFFQYIVLMAAATFVHSFGGNLHHNCRNTPLASIFGKEVMSDMDIMCLENAADLCSYYNECDVEERESLLNRFIDETEILAHRIAEMNAIAKHLTTGDHQHIEDEEVELLRRKILNLVKNERQGEALSP